MHRARCSQAPQKGCGRRFTLDRAPDVSLSGVRCPFCGSFNVNSVEASRRAETERLSEFVHTCSGYSFPHKIGAYRGCVDHPDHNKRMTQKEKAEHERLNAKKYPQVPG